MRNFRARYSDYFRLWWSRRGCRQVGLGSWCPICYESQINPVPRRHFRKCPCFLRRVFSLCSAIFRDFRILSYYTYPYTPPTPAHPIPKPYSNKISCAQFILWDIRWFHRNSFRVLRLRWVGGLSWQDLFLVPLFCHLVGLVCRWGGRCRRLRGFGGWIGI